MIDLITDPPTYNKYPIPEFNGNPLIEALNPPPFLADDAIKRLIKKPLFDLKELDIPAIYRSFFPRRLTELFIPGESHVQLMQNIYIQVLDGYKKRNPFTASGQQLLYSAGSRNSPSLRPTPATISFITGVSGMGKSTAIRAIMQAIGTPVIKHSCYNGTPFPETQITYLMRNIPVQHSARAVCKSFIEQTGELLGSERYSKMLYTKSVTRSEYISSLKKVIASFHVGALVIDEFQNISLANSGGKAELLSLIINLRDELGIPIILVGTYRTAALFRDDPSSARRLVEGGFMELERPMSYKDDGWLGLCEILWKYKWIQKQEPVSEEIIETIYDCSQGVTGIAINLYIKTQEQSILDGSETLSAQQIQKVYKHFFRPIHGIIDLLRSNDPVLLEQYDDLYYKGITNVKSSPLQAKLNILRKELETKTRDQLINLKEPEARNSGAQKSKKAKKSRKDIVSETALRDFVLDNGNTEKLLGKIENIGDIE